IANNEDSITVVLEKLSLEQKQLFLNAMASCLNALANREDILFLFFRNGAFQRSEEEQIPQEVAELYVTKMQEWLIHQQVIYKDELSQNKKNLAEESAQLQYDLALCYKKGEGVSQSYKEVPRRYTHVQVHEH